MGAKRNQSPGVHKPSITSNECVPENTAYRGFDSHPLGHFPIKFPLWIMSADPVNLAFSRSQQHNTATPSLRVMCGMDRTPIAHRVWSHRAVGEVHRRAG